MNLHREILRLAVPSILANITVPLVGMVDIAVVGHLGGGSAAALIGGISIGAMLFDLLYWNFSFLRAGTGGLTAQAFGTLRGLCPLLSPAAFSSSSILQPQNPGPGRASDDALLSQRTEALAKLSGILQRALRMALVIGVVLIALQKIAVRLAFLVVTCSPEVRELAVQYFYIRIWAAPATLSLFAFKGWFIGMQDSVRPMLADLLVNLANMFLSAALAFGWAGLPALGYRGVAIGTVIAQWSGFLYCSVAIARRYPNVLQSFKLSDWGKFTPDRSFFSLNRDLFLRAVCMVAVYIGFTIISARYGDQMLAVSSIIMQLLMLFSYFTDGFAYAGEALTGRFIGEQSHDGVRSSIRQTFAWSIGVAAFFVLLYGLGGLPMLRLMTSDASVVDAGRPFLPWLLLMPLVGCPAFTWDGIFVGATASKDLRNSTILSAVLFFAGWYAGLALAGGDSIPEQTAIHILMAAYFLHLLSRTVYQTVRYRKAVGQV